MPEAASRHWFSVQLCLAEEDFGCSCCWLELEDFGCWTELEDFGCSGLVTEEEDGGTGVSELVTTGSWPPWLGS